MRPAAAVYWVFGIFINIILIILCIPCLGCSREGSGGGGWGQSESYGLREGIGHPGTVERGEIGSKNSGAFGWVASAGGMDQL